MIAGKIVAGPHVRASCKRHLDDLKKGAARGLRFDVEKAQNAIDFFREVLKLNGGDFEGVPFLPGPWQCFIIGSLFGWLKADGKRRFRTAYIEAGKGNGKSPLIAGIGLLMLVADGEDRAEVYAAASEKQQAMILFKDAVAMCDQSDLLAQMVDKIGGKMCWTLFYGATNSSFNVISSEDGKSGYRPHCALIDELHEHKNRTVADMMRMGTKGRSQALIVYITNSGVDRKSICFQEHEYSVAVAAGTKQDDQRFSYICALDETDDPFADESCWIKANPNLGVSIKLDYIRECVREAKGIPAKESTVRRLNFCQWVDAVECWLDASLWMACEIETPDFDPYHEWKGRECVGGLDLSASQDLTALALAFPDGEYIDLLVEFWTPKDTLGERSNRDHAPYDAWVRGGYMHATPGRVVDYGFVAQRLAKLGQLFSIQRVGFDPWRIENLKDEIADAAVTIPLQSHGQGFQKSASTGLWMPRSIEVTESAIFEKRLRVVVNPCLRACIAHATMKTDPQNNRKFDKLVATGRIDGAVALAMAVGTLLNAEGPKTSIYESMGALAL